MIKFLATVTGFAIAVVLPVSSSHATLLHDKTVNLQRYYPDLLTPIASGANGNYLVGDGIEVAPLIAGAPGETLATLDFSDTNILVEFTAFAFGHFTTATFSGFVISDVFLDIDPFLSVSVNAATTMDGLDASRISFDEDSIAVNWQGLDFDGDTIISIDIGSFANDPASVPEPGALFLFGVGVAGLGLTRRRKTG